MELVEGGASGAVHVVMGVNELLRLLQLLEDGVVHGADVAVLKSILSGAMAEEQVRLSADLAVNERLVVLLVLSVVLQPKAL